MTRRNLFLCLLLVAALCLRLFLSVRIYSGDLNNHVGWGQSIITQGFSGSYSREYVGIMQPTYPPLSLYGFTTSVGLYRLTYSLVTYINNIFPLFPSRIVWWMENQNVLPAFTKIIPIVSDVGIGLIIYYLIRKFLPRHPNLALMASSAYLFNPAVWYTSSLWGQIESFPLFFLLLTILALTKRRVYLSHLSFAASLLCKQQMIIFIPLFLIISCRQFGLKKTVLGLLLQLLAFYLAFLPFFPGFDLLWPISIYINRIQTGSGSVWITDHAFNLWIWTSHLQKIPDTLPIFNIPVVYWGYFMFLVSAFTVFWVYIKTSLSPPRIFLGFAVLPMLAFTLLTKMHERYFAPAIPFLFLSSAFYPRLWPIAILVSLTHLANLHHEWWYPRINWLVNWLSSWSTIELISLVFIVCTFLIWLKTLSLSHVQK